jgi:hypothetical protein
MLYQNRLLSRTPYDQYQFCLLALDEQTYREPQISDRKIPVDVLLFNDRHVVNVEGKQVLPPLRYSHFDYP